jgi:glycosyltransferase involved in cell wall biosynthesis
MKDRLNLPTATVIPLGMPYAFRKHSVETDTVSDHRGFVVVFAGRLIPEKGVDVAILAIAEARRHGSDVRLKVIGDGPERSNLEDLARREVPEGAAAFLGAMEPEAALTCIRHADAVIVPSVWSEPAGFVVLEAMAMGVPVIASAVGGIPEIARGAATLVARSDPAALSRAVIDLASNPVRMQEMATQGRAVAAASAAENMAIQYLGLYRGLIGNDP